MPKFFEVTAMLTEEGEANVVMEEDIPATAEQHALDNPGHIVVVQANNRPDGDGGTLVVLDLMCSAPECNSLQDSWWDQQLF